VLQAAIQEAHARYTEKNALSKKTHDQACQYMPGGNTRTVLHATPFPMTIDRGEGCHLTTIDGNTYVDFLGEYTAGIYGHSHPIIKEAVQKALDGGWNYGAHNKLEPELARIVVERFPALDLVRFVNSGTEANMMALATALAYTGKKKVLLFNKGKSTPHQSHQLELNQI
jgi:glutamate-1-semialdehyde 2,1-aminomutase